MGGGHPACLGRAQPAAALATAGSPFFGAADVGAYVATVVHVDELDYVPLDRPGPTCCSGSSASRYERRSLVVTTSALAAKQN